MVVDLGHCSACIIDGCMTEFEVFSSLAAGNERLFVHNLSLWLMLAFCIFLVGLNTKPVSLFKVVVGKVLIYFGASFVFLAALVIFLKTL